MHAVQLAAALAVLACAAAISIGHHEEEYPHHFPVYKYEYGVHDTHHGDVKNQQESRHGDQVKGSYSLVDPDGKIRKVEYTSDKHTGFQAIVHRGGKVTLHGYGEQDVKGLDGGSSDSHGYASDLGQDDEGHHHLGHY